MRHSKWYSVVVALALLHMLACPIDAEQFLLTSAQETIVADEPLGDPGHGGGGLDQLVQPLGDPGHGGGGLG